MEATQSQAFQRYFPVPSYETEKRKKRLGKLDHQSLPDDNEMYACTTTVFIKVDAAKDEKC